MQANNPIRALARKAGEIAQSHRGRPLKIWEKGPEQGRVSEADLAVNDFLIQGIRAHDPAAVIFSEEGPDDPARLQADELYIIDPIDGTEAFLAGSPDYAIAIAYIQKGRPLWGIIYAPEKDEFYEAYLGQGAFLNGTRLSFEPVTDLAIEKARILATQSHYNSPILTQSPRLDIHFRPAITLRLALVAQGIFDATFTLRPSHEWDIAAGDILCHEAGRVLVDQNGKPPLYNKDPALIDGIFAGSPYITNQLLKRL